MVELTDAPPPATEGPEAAGGWRVLRGVGRLVVAIAITVTGNLFLGTVVPRIDLDWALPLGLAWTIGLGSIVGGLIGGRVGVAGLVLAYILSLITLLVLSVPGWAAGMNTLIIFVVVPVFLLTVALALLGFGIGVLARRRRHSAGP